MKVVLLLVLLVGCATKPSFLRTKLLKTNMSMFGVEELFKMRPILIEKSQSNITHWYKLKRSLSKKVYVRVIFTSQGKLIDWYEDQDVIYKLRERDLVEKQERIAKREAYQNSPGYILGMQSLSDSITDVTNDNASRQNEQQRVMEQNYRDMQRRKPTRCVSRYSNGETITECKK